MAAAEQALPALAATPVGAPSRRARLGMVFWIATAWIVALVAAALLADLLPLPNPVDMDMLERRAPPSAEHWLGTDGLGRDVAARLVFGARVSLIVGLCAPLISLAIGGALGLVAGYFRGRLDTWIRGAADVLLAFPPLVLALAVTAFMGQSLLNMTLILGFLGIPVFMRVARSATLALAQREFVTAARALGATHGRILVHELLPNVALPLAAFVLVAIAVTIVVECVLSFLGLGVPPPQPSWGTMIGEARESLDSAAWLAFTPAAVMFVTVLAFNLVGDTVRTLTDPRRALGS